MGLGDGEVTHHGQDREEVLDVAVSAGQGDVAGLTAAIRHWADNLAEAQQVGRQGRQILEERYTEQIGLRRYQEILES